MAQLVKKDTYLYEDSGAGNMVRRQVFAGQNVPDHYVEGEDTASGALEESDTPPGPGLGAGQAEYPFNRGVSVKQQLERRGLEADDEAVDAVTQGGAARVRYEQEQASKSSRSRKSTGGQVGNDETEIEPTTTPDAKSDKK